ncbi:cyclin-like protein [Colletotrichum cereale]|nr:cyclin-like protein [Colletotrichum cereale]
MSQEKKSQDEKLERQALEEYDEEIFDHLLEIEAKSLPLPYYMRFHTKLDWSDRRELVENFFSYSEEFSIPVEVVFLALNFVDRFLSSNSASSSFKLLGAVAFVLAVKYETPDVHYIYPKTETETDPSILETMGGKDKGYTLSDIQSIERQLLRALDYSLGTPSPFFFLRRIRTLDKSRQNILGLAQYLAASTMLNEAFVGTRPSLIAAASYFLSLTLLNHNNAGQYKSTLKWVSKVP